MTPPAARRTTEADVTRQCLDFARCVGLELERQNSGVATYPNADGSTRRVRYGAPGAPDYQGTWPRGPNRGRRVSVEFKAPGKRPSPKQLERLRRLNADGGLAFWVHDLDQFRRALQGIEEGCFIVIDERGDPWLDDGED